MPPKNSRRGAACCARPYNAKETVAYVSPRTRIPPFPNSARSLNKNNVDKTAPIPKLPSPLPFPQSEMNSSGSVYILRGIRIFPRRGAACCARLCIDCENVAHLPQRNAIRCSTPGIRLANVQDLNRANSSHKSFIAASVFPISR